MPSYTKLRGISNIGDSLLTDILGENLLSFFEWAFLEAGGFVNINVDSPGTPNTYGDETLVAIHKDGVVDGTIWQAPHADWCYETGLERSTQPTINTGIYINGTLYPTSSTTGTYAHYVNFKRGQIVFNSPIPTNSLLQAQYSYKLVSFFDNVEWFQSVIIDSMVDPTQSTALKTLEDNRIQTPFVVVECLPSSTETGLQLGSNALWVHQNILFHVVSSSKDECDKIMDAIRLQKGETIYTYNVNSRRTSNDFNLDWKGSPIGGSMYPDLITNYKWKQIWFENTNSTSSSQPPLFKGVVRATIMVDYNGV